MSAGAVRSVFSPLFFPSQWLRVAQRNRESPLPPPFFHARRHRPRFSGLCTRSRSTPFSFPYTFSIGSFWPGVRAVPPRFWRRSPPFRDIRTPSSSPLFLPRTGPPSQGPRLWVFITIRPWFDQRSRTRSPFPFSLSENRADTAAVDTSS